MSGPECSGETFRRCQAARTASSSRSEEALSAALGGTIGWAPGGRCATLESDSVGTAKKIPTSSTVERMNRQGPQKKATKPHAMFAAARSNARTKMAGIQNQKKLART